MHARPLAEALEREPPPVHEVEGRPFDELADAVGDEHLAGAGPVADAERLRHCEAHEVTGCTTSGCIPSTVVDALSYNFRVVVPEECVNHRGSVSHAVSLFDISEKYGDVCPVSDVAKRLRDLPDAA